MKRITILAAAGALVATPAFGVWAADAATSGAPAPHVRITERHGEPEPGDDHARHRHADDRGAHHRRADDAAGRHRHAEFEPGDDRGGVREAEPGDDRGGHDGGDDGDHHGGDDGGHHGHDD